MRLNGLPGCNNFILWKSSLVDDIHSACRFVSVSNCKEKPNNRNGFCGMKFDNAVN